MKHDCPLTPRPLPAKNGEREQWFSGPAERVQSGFTAGVGKVINLTIETERDVDGDWIAGVPETPGAVADATTEQEADAKAKALALRVLAERLDHAPCFATAA